MKETNCRTCGNPLNAKPGYYHQKFFCSNACRAVTGQGPQGSPVDRFWKYIEKDAETGCWLWVGALIPSGYGHIWIHEKRSSVKAHRFAWELHNGPIPDGLLVCHRCDVKRCVNPDHLFLGTQQDNVIDMWSKGRGDRHEGERNKRAKLTESEIREIRERYQRGGVSTRELGREFGVSKTHIMRITKGRVWAHVS